MKSHTSTLNYTLWFFALLLLQVMVFNNIHLLGYATPMPFIYAILILHNETPRWVYVVLGFILGLLIDITSNTIGENAAATTFLGLITPHLLNACSPPDRTDDGFIPTAELMKWRGFLMYVTTASTIHVSIFFIIENFSFMHPADLLLSILSSTALTILIICAIERVRISGTRRF